MKKLLCLLILLPALHASLAQTEIKPKTNKIKTKKVEGFELILTEDIDLVADSWTNYLKSLGKYKNWLLHQSISELSIDFSGEVLYALSDKNSDHIALWLGAQDIAEPTEDDYGSLFLNFEIQLRKDRVQNEIDETQRAVDFVQKRQNKVTREIETLESKKSYNEKELLRLQRLIEENKVEYAVIKTQIENKIAEQDSLVIAVEKAKGVLEVKKEKLKVLE